MLCEKASVSDRRVDCTAYGDLHDPKAPTPPYRVELELYLHEGQLIVDGPSDAVIAQYSGASALSAIQT